MLGVSIIMVGKFGEGYYKSAFDEYVKRLGGFCSLTVTEIPEGRSLKSEGEAILRLIPKGAAVIAMCIEGVQKSSEELSSYIDALANRGVSKICFIVGGSLGLGDEVKRQSGLRLSMSKMTFPHHLARVMLVEQIYRSFSIIKGTKYHK